MNRVVCPYVSATDTSGCERGGDHLSKALAAHDRPEKLRVDLLHAGSVSTEHAITQRLARAPRCIPWSAVRRAIFSIVRTSRIAAERRWLVHLRTLVVAVAIPARTEA